MDSTHANQIETGTDVFGSDGEKIGSVAGIGDTHFVIEKGFILTTDIYVPMSAVTGVTEDGVTLAMTKEQVENADWSHEPDDTSSDTSDDDASYATGAAGTAGTYAQDTGPYAQDTGTYAHGTDTDSTVDGDPLERREERLTGLEERLAAVEDRQAADDPVTREDVTVERQSTDRPVSADSFTDDSIDVPVYEEEPAGDTVRREDDDIDDGTGTTRPNR
ncbi:MAG: DUF2171 domain-containing protein [Chloroflexi bacterium]|nr:DUF2171 domain-containing protein [Chloroflexota bacterium]